MENNQSLKVTPFLCYNGRLDEAIEFYKSIFRNVKVHSVRHLGQGGKMMTATFEIEGQKFMALDAGPMFKFSEAISFFINCETQEEVDELWDKLSTGGEKSRCGWLKDPFGVWWQVIPSALGRLLGDPDPAKAGRVMQAMMKMDKMIIKDLEEAANG